jgi:kynurenine formamidase
MALPDPADVIRRVSNWGRWGADDELGTANLISEAKRVAAAALVRKGRSFSLAVDFAPDTPQVKPSFRLNPQRSMVATGADVRAGQQAAFGIAGHGFADDMVVMSLQAATQWDSLAHVFHDYCMYNGRDCALVGAKGAQKNDIAVLRDAVVTRGVLADVAGHAGVESLAPDHHITPEELEATLAAQGIDVGEGDALLIRTGHLGRIQRAGAWDQFIEQDEPGLGIDSLPWLHERGVAAVACDNWAFEVIPSGVEELPLPIHAIGIVYMGLLVGEIFELDALAADCRDDGVWEFLFSAPPLPFVGAVGSPVNPLAIK